MPCFEQIPMKSRETSFPALGTTFYHIIITIMYGLQEFDMIPYKRHVCTFFNGMEPYGPCMETHGKIRCRSFM